MQVVILAGGSVPQLHPWTSAAPKPLLPFFDRPVIEHAVRLLAAHDIREITVATSHHAKHITQYLGDGSHWQVDISYSIEDTPAGTAGAVRRLQSRISDTFMVMPSDTATDFDLSAALHAHKASGAIATILVHEVDDPSRFGIVSRDETNYVTRFLEKPRSSEIFSNTVSTGIYILEPEAISSIAPDRNQDFARHIFPTLLRNQEPINACRLPGYWTDLGDILQYRNAHFDALQGKLRIDLPAVYAGEGIWVGGGVDVHPSAQIAAPVFIGSGASIGPDVIIGAHSIVGAHTRIHAGSTLSHCVIGCGATVHTGSRIVKTVVASEPIIAKPEENKISPSDLVFHSPIT